MRESKLCQHLLLMPEPMRKQFRLYLASPYFNPLPRFVQLLEVLEEQLLRYKTRDHSEEEIWKSYFPDLPFDRNRFRKDCSAMLGLLTDFISQQAFQSDRPSQYLYLLQQLNILGENHYFNGYLQEANAVLDAAIAEGKPVFGRFSDIHLAKYRNDLGKTSRSSTVVIAELKAAAEVDYCIRKMELMYVEINHFLVTGAGEVQEDNAFLDLVRQRFLCLPLKTQLYFHLYKCTKDPSEEAAFQSFRALLGQMTETDVQRDFYSAALNYCARRLNAGFADYLRETHLLHREMLVLGLMAPEHQVLSPNFKNAVVVACRLGEFDWVAQLMHRKAAVLALPANQSLYFFSEGIIAYHAGKMDRAASFFHRLMDGIEDIFYALDARGYLLRIYYETGNLIGLEALIDSYRMYIKRQTSMTQARRQSHNEFIRYVRRLTHVDPHDHEAIEELHAEIQNSTKIPATTWLLKKTEELMKRRPPAER